MTQVNYGPIFPAAASSLRSWLNANAGTDPTLDDLAGVLTTRNEWLADPGRPGARRVRAVCMALCELCVGDDRSNSERHVRRMSEAKEKLKEVLDEYADVSEGADAQRGAYAVVAMMHGERRNREAASAFAFGPPRLFEDLRSGLRKLEQYVAEACAVTGYVPRRGRRDQYALVAASQHLEEGGFTEEEIAQLLPDGIPSKPEQVIYRVRNRLRDEDRRTVIDGEQPE